ncbi:MAG TPA: hypothetical protein VHV30_03300 [Polyangiaceae bacterium]|jgi:hypothetical protein|nr:hypothetical protein [Polyangiaceae bacterium]
MGLGPDAQRRLAIILADVFGESEELAAEVAAFLDRYLRQVPLRAAIGLRAVVWAITWMPIAFVGIPLPADALSPETRARYLAKWAHAESYALREGFFLLKAIALMGWGGLPAVRERLGVGPLEAAR